tara:strand:- start:167 stop:427 length:261 start_codon:yes stop_codon:yes gene_type:complete
MNRPSSAAGRVEDVTKFIESTPGAKLAKEDALKALEKERNEKQVQGDQTMMDRYDRMLKSHLPEGAVRQRMKYDGISLQEIDDFFK